VAGRAAGYAAVADRDVYRWFVGSAAGPKVVSTWVVARNTTHLAMDGPLPEAVRARLFAATAATRLKSARRLAGEGRFDEARADLLACLAERPDWQAAHLAQGDLELRAGNPAGAIGPLGRAIELSGGAPAEAVRTWANAYAAAFRRGIARLQTGDARGALGDLDWVLAADPTHLGALEAGIDAAAAARDVAWSRARLERARARAAALAPPVGEALRARLAALAARAGA
jgi:tetratricopeptide (TPR) repeat protein